MLNELHFQFCMENMSESYTKSFLLMKASVICRHLQALRSLPLCGRDYSQIFNYMNNISKNKSGVLCITKEWNFPFISIVELWEESIIIECWTFTSSQKLIFSHRMLLCSKRGLVLTLLAPSVPFWMKCFEIYEREDPIQLAGQRNYLI